METIKFYSVLGLCLLSTKLRYADEKTLILILCIGIAVYKLSPILKKINIPVPKKCPKFIKYRLGKIKLYFINQRLDKMQIEFKKANAQEKRKLNKDIFKLLKKKNAIIKFNLKDVY